MLTVFFWFFFAYTHTHRDNPGERLGYLRGGLGDINNKTMKFEIASLVNERSNISLTTTWYN